MESPRPRTLAQMARFVVFCGLVVPLTPVVVLASIIGLAALPIEDKRREITSAPPRERSATRPTDGPTARRMMEAYAARRLPWVPMKNLRISEYTPGWGGHRMWIGIVEDPSAQIRRNRFDFFGIFNESRPGFCIKYHQINVSGDGWVQLAWISPEELL